MEPGNLKFGGGLDHSQLHPFVLVAMLLAIVLIFVLPRKYIFAPVLTVILLLSLGQQLNLGGIHLYVDRIIVLAAWIRLLMLKRSYRNLLAGGFDSADKAFLLWACFHSLAMVLLFADGGAVVNQVGFLWDVVGGFFLLRFLVRDDEDVNRLITCLGLIAAVVAAGMLVERFRGVNVFGYLGVLHLSPTIREGSLRAQGPFAHALLGGTFGATLLPLFAWLWIQKRRMMAILGMASSTIITLMSASSTPIMAYAAGILGICLWPLRNHLRVIRWSIVGFLLSLQVVMKAPVWFIIARFDLVGGSSGYHRALLVDQFIRHFFEWWLIGTNSNGNWGYDMWDTCNQFVQEGLNGGILTLICFVCLIVFTFKRLGIARRSTGKDTKKAWLLWILGCTLFSHVVAFFGISYFDKMKVSWFAFLAMVPAVIATLPPRNKQRLRQAVVLSEGAGVPSDVPAFTVESATGFRVAAK
jgi:hypothetical protein